MATPNDPNLIPLTAAAAALSKHGVRLGYQAIWTKCVGGVVPTIRRGNRIYLVGQPADIAKLLKRDAMRLKAVKTPR